MGGRSERCLGGPWEASWEAPGRPLGGPGRPLERPPKRSWKALAWEAPLESPWKAPGRFWEAPGRPLGGPWEAPGRPLGGPPAAVPCVFWVPGTGVEVLGSLLF